MHARTLGYGALGLILLSVVLFMVASTERRYESTVARLKGTVIAKAIRTPRIKHLYGVTYRVTVEGRTIEREGDVGSQKAWDAIRIGDEIDVESVGATANETRLVVERLAGSAVYYGLSAAAGIAGVILIVLRIRRGASRA